MQQVKAFIMSNFPLIMLVLAILLPTLSRKNFALKFCNSLFLFTIGVIGISGFIQHTFHPDIADNFSSWYDSQFEPQIALIYLAFGISGITAAFAKIQYKIAIALMYSIFLWGIAINHLQQLFANHTFSLSTLGLGFLANCLIPLCLWLSILATQLAPKEEMHYSL